MFSISRRTWLLGLACLTLAAGGAHFWAQADTDSAAAPYNIERKARDIAEAVDRLQIAVQPGELIDITRPLERIRIRPAHAMPDYPHLVIGPSRIYVAAIPNCDGVAIAGIAEFDDIDRPQDEVFLSLVARSGDFVFRTAKLSHAGVIELIASLAADGSITC